jgi:hypothetical protein
VEHSISKRRGEPELTSGHGRIDRRDLDVASVSDTFGALTSVFSVELPGIERPGDSLFFRFVERIFNR